jgi:hypothetical protein
MEGVLTVNIGKLAPSSPEPNPTESFRMIPDRMTFDPRLDPGDMRVWACLAFLARFPTRMETTVTDQAIGEKLRVSPQTIRRALLRLERAGYLTRSRDGQSRVITLQPGGDGEPIAEFGLRLAAG